jgi:hypothetical protein
MLSVVALVLATGVSTRGAAAPRKDVHKAERVRTHVARASDGRGVAVEIRGTVAAPIDAVEKVLGDLDQYAAWIPAMRASKALPADPESYESVYHLPWPFGDVREVVRVRREHGTAGLRLAWEQLRGDLLRDEGRWTLVPRGDKTEVRYEATFQLRSWVPMFLLRMAEQRVAPRLLRNLEERAKQMAPAVATADPVKPI